MQSHSYNGWLHELNARFVTANAKFCAWNGAVKSDTGSAPMPPPAPMPQAGRLHAHQHEPAALLRIRERAVKRHCGADELFEAAPLFCHGIGLVSHRFEWVLR